MEEEGLWPTGNNQGGGFILHCKFFVVLPHIRSFQTLTGEIVRGGGKGQNPEKEKFGWWGITFQLGRGEGRPS